MSATILTSVFAQGGRTSRYGDFTIVKMQGASFITTPMEFMQMQNWARGRVSTGNPVKDRTTFVDRFETVLGRVGGGVASRGSKSALGKIVKAMKANAVFLEEWLIPHDLGESVEMKKPKPQPVTDRIRPGAAPPAANETPSAVVIPLITK